MTFRRARRIDPRRLPGGPFGPRNVTQHDEGRPVPARLLVFGALVLAVFAVLAVNLYNVQVRQGSLYSALADGNRVRKEIVPAPRGIVFDRHGNQLVQNQDHPAVSVVPQDLPRPGADRQRVLGILQRALGVTPAAVESLVREHRSEPFQPIVVKRDIDTTAYLFLSENLPSMPGVRLQTQTVRNYVTDSGLAHILGYVGKLDPEEYTRLNSKGYLLDDEIGKTGLELVDEGYLRGQNGVRVEETDARGAIVKTISTTQPVPGDNVYLTIDLGLQREVAKDLQASMDTAHKQLGAGHGEAGAAIVMNPQTGEVLSLVSLPDYNLNQFAAGITAQQYQALAQDPRLPLLDRAIDGLYPPGSTFKSVTGSAALQSGTINKGTNIFCPGFLQRGASRFLCWNSSPGHGNQNVVQAIAHSCDVFFYTVADQMGDLILNRFAKDFGVGRKTGIDLTPEAKGIAPDRDWKKAYFADALQSTGDSAWADSTWYEGNTITYGIGQSYLLVTPLQDLEWTATVANGGNYLKPQVTDRVTAVDGSMVRPFQRVVDHKVNVSPDVLSIVREGLRAAASTGGTSGFIWNQPAFKGVPTPSGKTGTAQYGTPDAKGNYPLHAWYTSFAPAVDPEVAVVVFVEGGGEGHEAAGPVAAQILSYYFAHRDQVRAN